MQVAANGTLRGKFKAFNIILKIRKSEINDLSFYFKKLENKENIKPKSRRK